MSPWAGTRVRPPPLPALPLRRAGSRRSSIFGGSGTVVVIRLQTPISESFRLRLVDCAFNLLGRSLHYVIAQRPFNAVLIRIVKNLRQFVAKVVVRRRRRRRAPLQRGGLPWVVGSRLAFKAAVNQVVHEDELCGAGTQRGDGDK